MRDIYYLIVHCSATPEGRPVSTEAIRRYHVDHNGWRDIGYHYVIELDGSVHTGRPQSENGAHTSYRNHDSIGICYVGGLAADGKTPKDTRTPAQKQALYELLAELKTIYPEAYVYGHREFANKACPSFDVAADYPQWRAPPSNADQPNPDALGPKEDPALVAGNAVTRTLNELMVAWFVRRDPSAKADIIANHPAIARAIRL